ncbi:hypothetical protein M0R72_11505 [Candidatus Pacearchaeota archaeon]|jgi:hypothetical protein|nr:hypothetical protein [Candidatus Pacearchaeota archaeon]
MENQQLILLLGELKGALGAVQGTVQGYDKQFQLVHGRISEVKNLINGLPCSVHENKISELENWQGCHNGADKEITVAKVKGSISLKNGLWLAAAGCGGSVIGGVLVWWLTAGIH